MQTKLVDVHEAEKNLPELLALAASGAEVILTENGVQRARLIPISKKRVLGAHPGAIWTSDDFDEPLTLNSNHKRIPDLEPGSIQINDEAGNCS